MQLALTVLAIAAAAIYLATRLWGSWRPPASGCGGGCGCAKPVAAMPPLVQLSAAKLRGRG